MQSDWLKKRCRRLVGDNALLKTMCSGELVPDSRGDRDDVGGVSGFCWGIPLQKLAALYQFLDLPELEAGPWMDVWILSK